MTPGPASPTIELLDNDGDGEMGFLLFLELVALGVMVWLLFKIDAKLQSIGDMIYDASKSGEPRRLTD